MDLQQHNMNRGTVLTTQQLATSRHARSSFASLTVEMAWLLPKVDKFRPSAWSAGVCLLVLRLLQTSVVAFVKSQHVQAAIVSCWALFAACLLREVSPMRKPSDNQVAVMSQILIFIWVFSLLLRLAGMFQRRAAAAFLGVALCAVTAGVFVTALALANSDRLRNERAIYTKEEEKEAAVVPTTDDTTASEAPAEAPAAAPSRGMDDAISVGIVDIETVDPEEDEETDHNCLGLGGMVVCR
jgi:hypothetical protein